MNATVAAAIAEELEQLEREKDPPAPPYGYGSDLYCDGDLVERMIELDPFAPLALGQALARRLDCPRGALPDDPDYGLDLRGYLNRGVTFDELRTLSTRIRNEVERDDRVDSVVVTLTLSTDGKRLAVELAVTPVDPQTGTFALTLAVTSAEVLIEAMRGPA